MKRLLLVVLLFFSFATMASAELSIVWDQVYEEIESGSPLDLVPLANGEFMYFVGRESAPTQIHAIRIDSDGVILSDSVFATTTRTYYDFDACSSIDGGALASLETSTHSVAFFKWDASGELTQSESLTSDLLYGGVVIQQHPDGSMILGGRTPDLLCVDSDLNFRWRRNYQDPNGFTWWIHQLISGVYLAKISVSDGSWWEDYIQIFTGDGALRGSFELNVGDVTPCPFDNTAIYLTYSPSGSYPCRVIKYGHWTRNLPNDVDIRESYRTVEPFNGLPGYLCAGYEFEIDGRGLFIEVSEAGIVGDLLTLPDSRFYVAKPKMNGEMVVAGKMMSADRMRLVSVTTGTTHTPISGKLWLHDAPRRLNSNGGVLHYRMLIGNDLDTPMQVRLEFILNLAGYPERTVHETEMTLQPNQPVVIPHDQLFIPSDYPDGDYSLTLGIYDENDELCSSSMQLFTKADPGSGNTLVDDEPVDPDQHYALAAVYPNPFNAATTINVTLPETAPLTVSVFDIQGRIVATLADGSSIAAGAHAFSFDGSNLSSGIYFVQATVPGRLNEVRKLMLVK